jgi:predicted TIM-barrel fold metal-dependent hydrolase
MLDQRIEAPRIIDADAHVLEPPDIWKNWLPSKYQDRAPQLVKDAQGGDAWLLPGNATPDPIGLVATPGMAWDAFRWTGVSYDEARPGCYDGTARLADMDLDGVAAEIIFPPQRTIGHFLGSYDDEFVLAGVEAYNNFLFENFCAPDPKRLIGMAQIPSVGIDVAVDALRKAVARGAKGIVISNWPSGNTRLGPDDDPFWAAAVDEGMPVAIHINVLSRDERAARLAAAQTVAAGATGAADAGARTIAGISNVFGAVAGSMSQLILTGVFERFSALHVTWIEAGVGWIPHFLEGLDDRYWRNRGWSGLTIKHPPSYYWQHNNSATFITDRTGIDLRHRIGIENMMWSTDYQNHGNDWPYSRKTIEDMMGALPEAEQAKLTGDNAARIWHLDRDVKSPT